MPTSRECLDGQQSHDEACYHENSETMLKITCYLIDLNIQQQKI